MSTNGLGLCLGAKPHEFQPRYDEIGQKIEVPQGMFVNVTQEGDPYKRIYRGDVCVRCGATVSGLTERGP